jgi:hypothetical protein
MRESERPVANRDGRLLKAPDHTSTRDPRREYYNLRSATIGPGNPRRLAIERAAFCPFTVVAFGALWALQGQE